jgi:hypothetical protein
MQRVAQRPHPVVAVELPGVAVIHDAARMSLEFEKVDPAGNRDQDVALVDPPDAPVNWNVAHAR